VTTSTKKKKKQVKCPTCLVLFTPRNAQHTYCHGYCQLNKAHALDHLSQVEQISDEMADLLKVAAGEVRGKTQAEIEAAQDVVTPALYEVAERIRLSRKDRSNLKGGQFHLQYAKVGRTATPVKFIEYVQGGHFSDHIHGHGGSEEDWE
jgi:hypothetical protein